MSLLFLTGQNFNLFSRGGTVSVSPSAASGYPASGLYDDDPSLPHIAGSISADSYMRVRQSNALANPGFETAAFSGWTDGHVGTGSNTDTTTGAEVRTGLRSAKLAGTNSSNYGSLYQFITVRAGAPRKATVYIKTPSSGTAKLFLRNYKTGLYYNGTTWGARSAAVSQAATGSWVAMSVEYTLESYSACRADTVLLVWEIACESGTVCFDDCTDFAGVNFASIHGHNYGQVIPLVQSSDDGSSWTTRATMTIKRPAFYSYFSTIYAEYWQIMLIGLNDVAPYTGEAVLGFAIETDAYPQWGMVAEDEFPGVRHETPNGRVTAYNFTTDPRRSLRMTFEAYSTAELAELQEDLWWRSAQGRYPTVIALTDTSEVFYGRITEPLPVASNPGTFGLQMYLRGDGLPTVGA